MKDSELQKMLTNVVPHQWKHGARRGLNNGSLRWLPLAKINEDMWYGLAEDGNWVAGSENKNKFR